MKVMALRHLPGLRSEAEGYRFESCRGRAHENVESSKNLYAQTVDPNCDVASPLVGGDHPSRERQRPDYPSRDREGAVEPSL